MEEEEFDTADLPSRRRRQEEKQRAGKGTPPLLLAAFVALLAVLGYLLFQRSTLVRQLEGEKADLTQQMVALQSDLGNMHSKYADINSQLDTSREQVALLIEKLNKTQATNRAKIRQYEKELGTLRSIMKGYIVQIDSLNTLNKRLTADARTARKEAAEARKANEELTQQNEALSKKVSAVSMIRARSVTLTGHYRNDQSGDRHSRVRYMVASVSLMENAVADKGPVRLYARVKDPEGTLLLNNESSSFTLKDELLQATASREIDYEGDDVDISIYINDVGAFVKGVYKLEVYTQQGLVGRAECLLR